MGMGHQVGVCHWFAAWKGMHAMTALDGQGKGIKAGKGTQQRKRPVVHVLKNGWRDQHLYIALGSVMACTCRQAEI